MKKYYASLFLVALILFSIFGASTAAAGEPVVDLKLTYPVGKSPRVFTNGWVFGASCIVNPGSADQQDLSSQVQWGGTGTFTPSIGVTSRPVFAAPGENTITLSVTVEGISYENSFTVNAISPYLQGVEGALHYAVIGDYARNPADAHGCIACPHVVKGQIITGSPTVVIDGRVVARKGDTGVAAACCGANIFEILEGDPSVLIDGRPAARIGEKTKHCGGTGKILGPRGGYYALFQMRLPVVKEDRKPRQRQGEEDQAWARRRIVAYQRLTYSDFQFIDFPLDKHVFLINVTAIDADYYLQEDFEPESERAVKINISGQGGQIEGSILLRVKGTAKTLGELIDLYPVLRGKDDLKAVRFASGNGVASITESNASGTIGPITLGWRETDKQAAVRLMKKILALMDCFIAHAAYEYGDLDKIEIFRKFRDDVLDKTEYGSHLMRLYYEYGPNYAISLRERPRFIPIARFFLDRIAGHLDSLDYNDRATRRDLEILIYRIDRVVSIFFKEGVGTLLGRLTKVFTPEVSIK